MQEFLTELVSSMVDDKQAVSINITEESSAIQVSIKVADSDCGTIVGKSGATIKAIREMLGIYQRIQTPDSYKRIFISVNE